MRRIATAAVGVQPRRFPREVPYDSDPYDVVAYRGGWVVADAGANDLLFVSAAGRVSLLARFAAVAEQLPAGVIGNPTAITIDAQPVPTSVAIGPDGALYVGLLRGVPSDPGTADIYRVVPGHQPAIWASGLTSVTSVAFDRQVLKSEPGPHGVRTLLDLQTVGSTRYFDAAGFEGKTVGLTAQ